jgi:3-isopropylmalate/(R)-2-methylmalate dehydratase small subunit
MTVHYQGRARVVGDNINTDYIISSRRKRDTLDNAELSKYLMEDIDPGFAARVKPGDFIVAGANFGCGSAMEVASLVIVAAGVPVILAKSFSRTFYRNGINGGLWLVACDTSGIQEDDLVAIDVAPDAITISVNGKTTQQVPPLPEAMCKIIKSGGIVGYMKQYGDFSV